MKRPEVLVSYGPQPAHREIFGKVLRDAANLSFLPDVPEKDRRKTIAEARVLVSWNLAKEIGPGEFGLLERLELIQLVTAGADHMPFGSLPARVAIASNPGAYAEPMAEHIVAMALALAKRLCVNHRKLREGEFDQQSRNRMVRGLTCGILGFGGIGRAASRLLRGFGMKIFALNTSGRTSEPVDFIGTLEDLDHLLKNADVLLVSIPLTVRTRGLIAKRELSLMKPDAILINVARGAVIDQKALYDHLEENPGFSAGIDTWWMEPAIDGQFRVDFPFFDLPNLLGSPHNSAVVPGVMLGAVEAAAKNVLRFLQSEGVRGELRREDYL